MTSHKFAIAAMTCATFVVTAASARAAEISTDVPSKRLRVIMTSDFPPFPVTNSDPDDVQSLVRFVLYANEFDIEGVIASAGTFGMVAKKENILAVLDEYDKVDENLRKHDPKYPTADALRAVTFEGKGNNNGISIKWGCGKQPPWTSRGHLPSQGHGRPGRHRGGFAHLSVPGQRESGDQ